MPLQHYLPATYLALFSTDTSHPRRRRSLAVGATQTGRVFTAPACRVAAVHDLYTLSGEGSLHPHFVDYALSGYERRLYFAVEQLRTGRLKALAWATTLVPFVTALLVRGPDFNTRFEARVGPLLSEAPSDNTSFARLLEYQRLLASIAGARWSVLRTQGDEPLITNDLGYAPFANPKTRDRGIAVPLGLDRILAIAFQRRRVVAFAQGGEWVPTIRYMDSPPDDHVSLNRVVASMGRRFVFGPDVSTVTQCMENLTPFRGALEPRQLGFMVGHTASMYELTWHSLISGLSKPPRRDGEYLYVNFLKSDRRNP